MPAKGQVTNREIVLGLSNGDKPKDMGLKYGLSPRTIEAHISRLLLKHNCKNSCHLVAKYLRREIEL